MKTNLDAEDIAEELLFETGRALLGLPGADVGHLFEVPQVLETPAGKRLVNTEDDVREVFARLRTYFAEERVTDVVRCVLSSEFLSDHEIGSTHVSQLMRADGSTYRAPYPSYSVIRRTQGQWRIASSLYAIVDNPAQSQALAGVSSLIDEDRWAGPPAPISGSAARKFSRNAESEGRRRP